MINTILKKLYSYIPFISNNRTHTFEINEAGWNEQYSKGRWSYLDQLSELAHYSVIVGYCQFFAREGKILDVGCGEGVLQQRLSVLPYEHYTGIDISSVAINNAQQFQNERTEFIVANAMDFGTDKRYDIIIFNESLYCFQDCISVLRHYQPLLNESGLFVISMHVQEFSLKHWESIKSAAYKTIDSVTITQQNGTSWICKTIQPQQNACPTE